MLISTKGRYALRVLIDMAEHRSEGYIPLKEVAQRQEISEKYLESIVKSLVSNGVVTGLRGKGGGYRLGKSPDQILVKDVLEMTEGPMVPVACLEDSAGKCPRMTSCRTLPLWKSLNESIERCLSSYSVADLMRSDEPGNDYVI